MEIPKSEITFCSACGRVLDPKVCKVQGRFILCKHDNRFTAIGSNSFGRNTPNNLLTNERRYKEKMGTQKKKEKVATGPKVKKEKVPGKSVVRGENAEKVIAFMKDTLGVVDKSEQRKICSNCYGKIASAQKAK